MGRTIKKPYEHFKKELDKCKNKQQLNALKARVNNCKSFLLHHNDYLKIITEIVEKANQPSMRWGHE